jgi:hypothetical protein
MANKPTGNGLPLMPPVKAFTLSAFGKKLQFKPTLSAPVNLLSVRNPGIS